jgi:hypothetical protein
MTMVPVATLAAPRIVADCYENKTGKSAYFLVRPVESHAKPPTELEKVTADCVLELGKTVVQVSPFWKGQAGACRRFMSWDVDVFVAGDPVFESHISEKSSCESSAENRPFLGSVEVFGNQMTVCETSSLIHGHGADRTLSVERLNCETRSLATWQAATFAVAK